MALKTRKDLPRINRVSQALSETIYVTEIRSELMELHLYYCIPQMQLHLETPSPWHGHGNPRVPAVA